MLTLVRLLLLEQSYVLVGFRVQSDLLWPNIQGKCFTNISHPRGTRIFADRFQIDPEASDL